MYAGRRLEELQNAPLSSWSWEELAYFKNSLTDLEDFISDEGARLLRRIEGEIRNRGGLPEYGGSYDLPSGIITD
ncbi:hypothetical protein [Effusibacillus pohliae]|uniref:hypothetical protein n=1 Tax=Effusibacillus pohliae TaxID=232270 RepID=UPI0003692461|nr:hypothetical protein [Effusibacillus pohliae]